MPIKLLVTHSGDNNAAPDEYVFDQETVMIGRDNANLLTLPDPARVVSKHHAEIRESDAGFELVDLGSKNFTYLNGKRLTSGQPTLLNPGDRFKIGEFEVQFFPEAPSAPEEQRTVFIASFENPFEASADKLAEVLGNLRRVYAGADAGQRTHALRDALESAMIGGGDEPGVIVAKLLGGDAMAGGTASEPFPAPPAALPYAPPPAQAAPPAAPAKGGDPFAQTSASAFQPFMPPSVLPADLPPQLPPQAPPQAPPPQAAPPPSPQAPAYTPPTPPPAPAYAPQGGPAPAGGRVFDTLVEAVAKLAPIPWRFRHEFIGQTIVQSSESTFVYEMNATELKAYLTEPHPDPSEQERRLAALTEATDAVAVHQLAMLDGYKASVQQGAKRLLDEVDPAPIEAEVEGSGAMYKVAQFRSPVVLDRLKEIHRELGGEDWSVAERRAFRPAFIKAYLARMTRRKL
ncbi:MAG: FHA domain-containing protein [Rhodothermales bacterium]